MSIKCETCGEHIDDQGWMNEENGEEHYFCDEHHTGADREFRICRRCGEVMLAGFTDEGNDMGYRFLCCEECFEEAMAEHCPAGWRVNDDGDGCGGYYEEYDPREQEWGGTGIYWTEWY